MGIWAELWKWHNKWVVKKSRSGGGGPVKRCVDAGHEEASRQGLFIAVLNILGVKQWLGRHATDLSPFLPMAGKLLTSLSRGQQGTCSGGNIHGHEFHLTCITSIILELDCVFVALVVYYYFGDEKWSKNYLKWAPQNTNTVNLYKVKWWVASLNMRQATSSYIVRSVARPSKWPEVKMSPPQ